MACSGTTKLRALVACGLACILVGCSNALPRESRFDRTGELIALSGGDAGARGACVVCHGLDGEGDGQFAPRLAGLDRGYILRQLEFFAEGPRHHPQMSWIAERLGNEARQKVAHYYSELPVPVLVEEIGGVSDQACSPRIARLYHEGDPERGLPACASCHGEDGRGVGRGNPPLADQPAPYLERQLRRWRNGERYGDPLGVMTRIGQRLREEELAPLADYSAHLTGGRNRPEPRAACLRARRPDPRSGA